MLNNPKLDVVIINAYEKFGQNPSKFPQDIERKRKCYGRTDGRTDGQTARRTTSKQYIPQHTQTQTQTQTHTHTHTHTPYAGGIYYNDTFFNLELILMQTYLSTGVMFLYIEREAYAEPSTEFSINLNCHLFKGREGEVSCLVASNVHI